MWLNWFCLLKEFSRLVSVFSYFFNFYWSMLDLQCVNFCGTANWFRYTHIYILSHILFFYGLSQDTEYSSLCYTLGPCCLSITNKIALHLPNPKLPVSSPTLGNLRSVLCVHESPALQIVPLYHILDSTYKWYHVLFVFSWLPSLSMIISRFIHIATNGKIPFLFIAE